MNIKKRKRRSKGLTKQIAFKVTEDDYKQIQELDLKPDDMRNFLKLLINDKKGIDKLHNVEIQNQIEMHEQAIMRLANELR